LLDDWLRRAYRKAELTPERGSMWHAFRRKFATERKGHAVQDVAYVGGWKDLRTVQNIYQQADTDSMLDVLVHPTHRVGRAKSA
jgi:hypothetical protein